MSWWYETTEEESKMEFDKSKVFGAVNADELKAGDKVIVADSLGFLRQEVERGKYIEPLRKVLDESHLQRFKTPSGADWGLAYLVERKENCTNCVHRESEGCKSNVSLIKCCRCYTRELKQAHIEPEAKLQRTEKTPAWFVKGLMDGSIERTSDEAKPHYRPFMDTDELIEEWDKKLNYRDPTGLAMPYIWVRSKFNKDHKGCLITNFFGKYVLMNNQQCFLSRLFDEYTFLDGTPCGVEA